MEEIKLSTIRVIIYPEQTVTEFQSHKLDPDIGYVLRYLNYLRVYFDRHSKIYVFNERLLAEFEVCGGEDYKCETKLKLFENEPNKDIYMVSIRQKPFYSYTINYISSGCKHNDSRIKVYHYLNEAEKAFKLFCDDPNIEMAELTYGCSNKAFKIKTKRLKFYVNNKIAYNLLVNRMYRYEASVYLAHLSVTGVIPMEIYNTYKCTIKRRGIIVKSEKIYFKN